MDRPVPLRLFLSSGAPFSGFFLLILSMSLFGASPFVAFPLGDLNLCLVPFRLFFHTIEDMSNIFRQPDDITTAHLPDWRCLAPECMLMPEDQQPAYNMRVLRIHKDWMDDLGVEDYTWMNDDPFDGAPRRILNLPPLDDPVLPRPEKFARLAVKYIQRKIPRRDH